MCVVTQTNFCLCVCVVTQTNFCLCVCVCVVTQTNFCLCVSSHYVSQLVCVCGVTLQEGQIGERDSVSEANRYVGEERKHPAGARIWARRVDLGDALFGDNSCRDYWLFLSNN